MRGHRVRGPKARGRRARARPNLGGAIRTAIRVGSSNAEVPIATAGRVPRRRGARAALRRKMARTPGLLTGQGPRAALPEVQEFHKTEPEIEAPISLAIRIDRTRRDAATVAAAVGGVETRVREGRQAIPTQPRARRAIQIRRGMAAPRVIAVRVGRSPKAMRPKVAVSRVRRVNAGRLKVGAAVNRASVIATRVVVVAADVVAAVVPAASVEVQVRVVRMARVAVDLSRAARTGAVGPIRAVVREAAEILAAPGGQPVRPASRRNSTGSGPSPGYAGAGFAQLLTNRG